MDEEVFGFSNWLKAIGGIAFFVAGLLPWWQLEYRGFAPSFNAFDYTITGLVPYVIFVAIALLTIIINTDSLKLPGILIDPTLTLLAAVIGTVLVGIRFFVDGFNDLEGGSITRGIGIYLAVASALVVLAGSVQAWRTRPVFDEGDDDGEEELVMRRYIAERERLRKQADHPPTP